MREQAKYLPGLLLICLLWLGLSLLCWFKTPQASSISERRQLAQLPQLSASTLLSGSYMRDFGEYALDQFPLRDSFRRLKAASVFYLFQQKDNNGIYLVDGYAAQLEYPLNESSVLSAAQHFTDLYNNYMKDANVRVYLSIIPDKSYFLAAQHAYPTLDYARLFTLMQENMPFATFIDIRQQLDVADYYRTDTHWRQECLLDVAQALAEGMECGPIATQYEEEVADVPFYGVYYGQSALPLDSEEIHYLRSPVLDACTVYNVETGSSGGIYALDKLESRDPYEVFLQGAAPLLYIENPLADTSRELVVFRDSFASSLVPLLVENYAKITLVDTRYIASTYVGEYVDFTDCDVLFLYSTLLLNNSAVLK